MLRCRFAFFPFVAAWAGSPPLVAAWGSVGPHFRSTPDLLKGRREPGAPTRRAVDIGQRTKGTNDGAA